MCFPSIFCLIPVVYDMQAVSINRHIVKLLAIFSNHDTNLLVYEYMTNGSLRDLLHGNNGNHLVCQRQYIIVVEAAKGLCYLQHDCRPVILHRDMKTTNIILDSNFEAHVAYFGLPNIFHHSRTSKCMSLANTFGYIDLGKLLFHLFQVHMHLYIANFSRGSSSSRII